MTPNTLAKLLLPSKSLDALARKSKGAKKAVGKARRKLAQARKAKDLTSIRLLLGMAQVALAKAEFLAQTTKGVRS